MTETTPAPSRAALDALRGLSCGDAFGQQWFDFSNSGAEGPPARVATRQPREGTWRWTDDTAMAVVLHRELAAGQGVVDQNRLAAGFAAAYAADPYRAYGGSMHRVLERIGAGEPWQAVTTEQFDGQGSFGNGAAMRVAPLGAYLSADLDAVTEQAARSAEVTHHHPEATAGAVAVAVAAALARRSADHGRPAPTPAEFLSETAARTPDSEVRSGLRIAARFPAATSVAHAASVLGSGYRISAQDTVPFALWTAATHLDDYAEALWATAAGGGDMDTTCAITGGVVASRTGAEPIPKDWLEHQEPLPDLT
jgi:ADP-ribosylglycohydrolase